ncbi:MAG: STAS domain-containing protein [Actinomycetota bacterium]|nr:STAS domain-containing protein [Actinomycetota bacterium]
MTPTTRPLDLTVESIQENGEVLVCLAGELDMYTAPALQERLEEVIAEPGTSAVVLELSRLSFIDSSGLSAIVMASRKLGDRGGELNLSGPSPAVRRVLEITGISTVIPVRPT